MTNRTPDAQNRLYWLYLGLIEEETDNDRDALHEHFEQTYLKLPPQALKTPRDDVVEVQMCRSTTTLSKQAFSEYMQKIERDSGVPIPDTHPY